MPLNWIAKQFNVDDWDITRRKIYKIFSDWISRFTQRHCSMHKLCSWSKCLTNKRHWVGGIMFCTRKPSLYYSSFFMSLFNCILHLFCFHKNKLLKLSSESVFSNSSVDRGYHHILFLNFILLILIYIKQRLVIVYSKKSIHDVSLHTETMTNS